MLIHTHSTKFAITRKLRNKNIIILHILINLHAYIVCVCVERERNYMFFRDDAELAMKNASLNKFIGGVSRRHSAADYQVHERSRHPPQIAIASLSLGVIDAVGSRICA